MKSRLLILMFSVLFITGCDKSYKKYPGYVSADYIYVSTPASGKLINLAVTRGESVKKGQLLFELEPKPQSYLIAESKAQIKENHAILVDLIKPERIPAIDSIKAQLAQNQSHISLATIRLKRNRTLFNKNVLAKDSLDLAREHLNELLAKKDQINANMELAQMGARIDKINAQKFQVQSLNDKLKNINWILLQKTLYAPDDGIVADTYFLKDEYVPATKPVLSLLFNKNIYIEFYLPYIVIQNLKLGSEIKYVYLDDDNLNNAKVVYISPFAEYIPPLIYSRDNMDKIVFKVRASISDANNNLKVGLPITVFIDDNYDK
jgi:HlyD family secretion protein